MLGVFNAFMYDGLTTLHFLVIITMIELKDSVHATFGFLGLHQIFF